jgi:hypothetical protein
VILRIIAALALHFLADFVLQPREMGRRKSEDLKWLTGHLAIQFVCFLPFGPAFAGVNAVVHGLIDWHIWRIYKWSVGRRYGYVVAAEYPYWNDHYFYLTIGADQLLHAITLVALVGYL